MLMQISVYLWLCTMANHTLHMQRICDRYWINTATPTEQKQLGQKYSSNPLITSHLQ